MAKPVKRNPSYHVYREGETPDDLTIIERNVIAAKQEDACDQVVHGLPAGERSGTFGAFLSRGNKAFPYVTETVTETRRGASTTAPDVEDEADPE